MKTFINTAQIRDFSGAAPTVIYSNPVTTVLIPPAPDPCCYRCCDCDCCDNCCRICECRRRRMEDRD